MIGPLLIVVAALDGLTGLSLPHGAEANLVPAAAPVAAFALKIALAGVVAFLALRRFRYFDRVVQAAIGLWAIGLASNLAVLVR
ncbi:MAG TPA: hypothetical protein VLD58_11210 [Gemmatimonadales bacterium]|nr:hypothetical protein [Gemmatimonadales bacterium]